VAVEEGRVRLDRGREGRDRAAEVARLALADPGEVARLGGLRAEPRRALELGDRFGVAADAAQLPPEVERRVIALRVRLRRVPAAQRRAASSAGRCVAPSPKSCGGKSMASCGYCP